MKKCWAYVLSILLIIALMAVEAMADTDEGIEVSIDGDEFDLSLDEIDIEEGALDVGMSEEGMLQLEDIDLLEGDSTEVAGGEMLASNEEGQIDPETDQQMMEGEGDFVIENGVLVKYNGPGGDVVIPDGVTGIGDDAFYECKSLVNISIPDSVTNIGEFAFWSCESLTSIVIPQSVVQIGSDAFAGCDNLSSITLPDSLTCISSALFKGCTRLKEISIPGSVTSIGSQAFQHCFSLTSIVLPNGITDIGIYTFNECESLTSVTLPDSLLNIGEGAFESCSGLVNLNLPDKLTSIGEEAFSGCIAMKNVSIPSGISSVGANAFKGCDAVNFTVYVTSATIGDHAFANVSMSRLTIEEGVKIIDEYAFYGTKNLKEIKLPASLTEIREGAFEQCGMTEILIPRKVKKIGVAAFFDCRQLRTITFGSRLTAVGRDAFFGCRKLTTINISKNMTDVCDGMFKGCEGITKINIPETVGIIGNSAFESCSGLTSVSIASAMGSVASNDTMSNAVTPQKVAIGSSTFKGCGSLKKIIIPANVTKIASDAFEGCLRLTICGEKGSYAQSYAKEHDIPFKTVKLNTPPMAIIINQGKRATLYMGNKLRLKTTVEPAGATTTLTWKSSKPKIAGVDKQGLVIPKKAGKTIITVKTANGKTAKITVKVVDASGVKLKEGKSKTLKAGKRLTLHAVVSPAKVKTKLTWKSSNTKVATVSGKGVVIAKKAGTATITVKTANGKKASIKITVE